MSLCTAHDKQSPHFASFEDLQSLRNQLTALGAALDVSPLLDDVSQSEALLRSIAHEATRLANMAAEKPELGVVASELKTAIDVEQFELFYQPQTDLEGSLRGMEALLRWRHPVRGLLLPAAFLPLAEQTGLIVPLGAWVLREACRQCVIWNAGRQDPLKISVNVSALQLQLGDFTTLVFEVLAESGLAAACLELELTESVVVRDAAKVCHDLQRLRSAGVSVAIDDFGTGYSALSYLRTLPLDVVKIDRSFLEHSPTGAASAVLEAITTLAHRLGLTVIAEGIENEEQVEIIRALKIDLAQGYLISRPVPAQKATALIARHDSTDYRCEGLQIPRSLEVTNSAS